MHPMPRLAFLAALLFLAVIGPATDANAQGVAPGGSIANTTGIGSGLATQGGTSPSYPNGTTQPVLPAPPPPGGGGGVVAPYASPRPSSTPPAGYSFESRPRKPSVVPLELPAAPEANLTFLRGCWRTDVFKRGEQVGLSTWCFDARGEGKVMYTRINQPDFFCHGPAAARYAATELHLESRGLACNDGSSIAVGELDCRRNGSEGVRCSGGEPTATLSERWTVGLYRVR
jgi:hypothetical protein